MEKSYLKGFGFGLTSGIITTLGMMIGLHSGTHSRLAVLGGIFVIAVCDAFSDAMGMHVSEESVHDGGEHKHKEVWGATVSTWFFKFFTALLFVIPVLLLPLETAMIASVIGGLILISIFSYVLAKQQGSRPWHVVAEHVLITFVVIVMTHYIGDFVNKFFGEA
jgi:VIT1/CCC1 family predicted Fe2+/Mn2+ transporter